MDTSRLLLFIFFAIVIQLFVSTIAQLDVAVLHQCFSVTSNSTYRVNRNSLLSSLSSRDQIGYGFYNSSAGENLDKVNAIALCRGDLTLDEFRNCVYISSLELLIQCPDQKEGIIWLMNCTVRYSNNSIFGIMEVQPVGVLQDGKSQEPTGTFKQVRRTLLERLRSEAASGDSPRKLATGIANTTYFTIYALLQCTPDLDEKECSSCLNWTIGHVPACCDDALGVRVLTPSCNLRYENNIFYSTTTEVSPPSSSPPSTTPEVSPPSSSPPSTTTDVSPPLSSPPPSLAKGKESNSSRTTIIVVAVLGFLVLIICACVCICLRLRKQRKKIKRSKSNTNRTAINILVPTVAFLVLVISIFSC